MCVNFAIDAIKVTTVRILRKVRTDADPEVNAAAQAPIQRTQNKQTLNDHICPEICSFEPLNFKRF